MAFLPCTPALPKFAHVIHWLHIFREKRQSTTKNTAVYRRNFQRLYNTCTCSWLQRDKNKQEPAKQSNKCYRPSMSQHKKTKNAITGDQRYLGPTIAFFCTWVYSKKIATRGQTKHTKKNGKKEKNCQCQMQKYTSHTAFFFFPSYNYIYFPYTKKRYQ